MCCECSDDNDDGNPPSLCLVIILMMMAPLLVMLLLDINYDDDMPPLSHLDIYYDAGKLPLFLHDDNDPGCVAVRK